MTGRDKIRQLVTDAMSGQLRMSTTLHQIHQVVNDESYWKQERREDSAASTSKEKEPELDDPGQDNRSLLDLAIDFLPDAE